MLNEKKIQLMTRLAILEKERGKELQKVRETYRSDYVGIPMLKNGLRVTTVFGLLLCIAAVGNLEFLLEVVAQMELKLLAVGVLAAYLVILLVSEIITFLCASEEYYQNLQDAQEYEELLKGILETLEEE